MYAPFYTKKRHEVLKKPKKTHLDKEKPSPPPRYGKIFVSLHQFLEKLNDRLIVNFSFFLLKEEKFGKYTGVCENPGFFVRHHGKFRKIIKCNLSV